MITIIPTGTTYHYHPEQLEYKDFLDDVFQFFKEFFKEFFNWLSWNFNYGYSKNISNKFHCKDHDNLIPEEKATFRAKILGHVFSQDGDSGPFN